MLSCTAPWLLCPMTFPKDQCCLTSSLTLLLFGPAPNSSVFCHWGIDHISTNTPYSWEVDDFVISWTAFTPWILLPEDPHHHTIPSNSLSLIYPALPQNSSRLHRPGHTPHQLEEQMPSAHVQSTPVRRATPEVLQETRHVLSTLGEDSAILVARPNLQIQENFNFTRHQALLLPKAWKSQWCNMLPDLKTHQSPKPLAINARRQEKKQNKEQNTHPKIKSIGINT